MTQPCPICGGRGEHVPPCSEVARKPPFAIEYQHRGKRYAETIWAQSWDDAEARLASIARTGEVVGSNVTEIPAGPVMLPFASLWVRIACWWGNLGR